MANTSGGICNTKGISWARRDLSRLITQFKCHILHLLCNSFNLKHHRDKTSVLNENLLCLALSNKNVFKINTILWNWNIWIFSNSRELQDFFLLSIIQRQYSCGYWHISRSRTVWEYNLCLLFRLYYSIGMRLEGSYDLTLIPCHMDWNKWIP